MFGNSRISHVLNQRSVADDVPVSGLEIFSAFMAATFAAFAAIYTSDSFAPMTAYFKELMNLSDSMVGWMSSVVYFPSLFMGVVFS